MIGAKVEIELDDAPVVAEALGPDDVDWAKCYSTEGKLIIEAESERTGSMLSVLDDYMVNVKVAQSLLELLGR
ncbi:MAG: KEOPS complex subunit Pcc1 [Archaeoglobaceae archaeon]